MTKCCSRRRDEIEGLDTRIMTFDEAIRRLRSLVAIQSRFLLAHAIADQPGGAELAARFAALSKALADNEAIIIVELVRPKVNLPSWMVIIPPGVTALRRGCVQVLP